MDYSQLSDFEINCEVLSVFKPDVNYMCLSESKEYFYDCGPVGDGWHQIDIPDYCNNAADAWPIIVDNEISLNSYSGTWEASYEYDAPIGAFGTDELVTKAVEGKNPLRTAMIAFMMKREHSNA